jgi:squalene cyclase
MLRLLLAAQSENSRDRLKSKIDEVLALQNEDGGWSQLPDLKSDAFSTGEALYTLSVSGTSNDHPSLKRGVNFLVATQRPDGSWLMESRSTPDGSPGSSKLLTPITCAASSWAVLGLTTLVPNR